MYCIECGQILPSVLTNSTICSKCKTPVATWWDETSKTFRTNRESILPDPSPSSKSSPSGASPFYVEEKERLRMKARVNRQSEEERVFNGALSLNRAEVRYVIFSTFVEMGGADSW
jgi:palmitoyltransferase